MSGLNSSTVASNGVAVDIFRTCYTGGLFGLFLKNTALAIAISLWFGIAFYSFAKRNLYLQFFSSSWWIGLYVSSILLEQIAELPPNTFCKDGFANPSPEAQFLYHHLVLSFVYRYAFDFQFSWFFMIRGIVISIGTLVILWYSGNYKIHHLVIGALVGILVALFAAFTIFTFWRDRIHALARTWLVACVLGFSKEPPLEENQVLPIEDRHFSNEEYEALVKGSTIANNQELHLIRANPLDMNNADHMNEESESVKPFWRDEFTENETANDIYYDITASLEDQSHPATTLSMETERNNSKKKPIIPNLQHFLW